MHFDTILTNKRTKKQAEVSIMLRHWFGNDSGMARH